MVSTAISRKLVNKRCCAIPVKCFVLVVCLVMNIGVSMSQGYVGDACTLVSGQRGTCRDLSDCSSFYAHPSKGDTCGYRVNSPIVCCLENLVVAGEADDDEIELFGTRPSGNRPAVWGLPTSEDEDEDEYLQPTTRRPTTRRPKTRRPTWKPDTPGPWTFDEITTRPRPRPTSSQQPGAISKAKCVEYARPVRGEVQALPLLPVSEPVTHFFEKCHFNQLQLIVGGSNTTVGEFPHMVALGYLTSNGYAWNCGGSLISERYVMTAGHCTNTKSGPLKLARLGEQNLKSDYDGASPVDYHVEKIIRHPDYSFLARYNDIALLQLTERVKFTENIRPACLYTRTDFDVSKAVVTGWGQTGFTEDPSDNLLKVAIDIIDNTACNTFYRSSVTGSDKLSKGIVSSMMCAGTPDPKEGKDTCLGDSGGPMQISHKNNACVHYVIGVTSFGKFCGNSPGVYTRVSAFIPWIESIVWPSG